MQINCRACVVLFHPMGRRNNCLVTILAVCFLLTLFQNIRNIVRVRISSSSELDRNNDDESTLIEKRTPTSCKKYHVALIIATAHEAREASYLLKTLMYQRRSIVHLHFVVNDLTHRIMKTLMETWELDQVYFDLYEVNSTIDTAFYWEALKFRLSDFLDPTGTKQVVYLANDVRLLDDMSVLWKEVEKTERGNKFLGLVTYDKCDNGQEFCFTDKIVMFDLNKFRHSSLHSSLRAANTKTEVDAILMVNRNHCIFSIPCSWAVSLNVESHRLDCAKDWHTVKALVQGGYRTSFVNDSVLERVREHLATVLNSEPSTILPLDGCSNLLGIEKRKGHFKVKGMCAEFANAANLKRRTHLFYLGDGGVIGKQVSSDPYEVSLLTQLTLDRFGVLERFLKNWKGPATVVFHLTDAEAMELDQKVQESSVLRSRKSVTYHVVYKRQLYNPINYLRNVAIDNSYSPYLLFVDVDLVPNPGLYKSLKELIRNYMNQENVNAVLVVPAFQMFTDLGDVMPTNKSQLLKLMANKTIVGYGMENSWSLGHKPTNYSLWISAEEPYQAVFSESYEPYVVVRKELEARYNEHLIERMADKIAYSRLLHEQGLKFYVIPDDFVIHVPHPYSPGRLLVNNDPKFTRCKFQFLKAYYKKIHARWHGKGSSNEEQRSSILEESHRN